MPEYTTFVGLDVHNQTIAIAVADGKEVRTYGSIPNTTAALDAWLRKMPAFENIRVCYEAGVTGFVVHRYFAEKGIKCDVVAPSLIPRRAGDRVKTDRKDAVMLARLLRAGELTSCYVPTEADESFRDLVRTREDAKNAEKIAKLNLLGFLSRHKIAPSGKVAPWTQAFTTWTQSLRLQGGQQVALDDYIATIEAAGARVKRLDDAIAVEAERSEHWPVIRALMALKGVSLLTAVTLVTELGEFSRFLRPTGLMSYAGLVPSEHSSGQSLRRAGITKTGNARIRKVMGETAWHYTRNNRIGKAVEKRREGLSPEVIAIADKALKRLNHKYWRLTMRGVNPNKAVTALARELLGFAWAIGVAVERQQRAAA